MTKDEISSEIKKLKEYAKEENIPIIQDEGMDFLTSFIADRKSTRLNSSHINRT